MASITKKKRTPSTYRRIWETLDEVSKRNAQWQAEWEAKAEKQQAAAEKRHAEAEARLAKLDERLDRIARGQEELNRSQKELDKKFGRLTNRLGEWAECTLVPQLPEKFRAFGYTFSQINRNVFFNDAAHDIAVEMDGFLENGDCCVAVEVKVKPDKDDIAIFIRRLEKIRRFMDIRKDARKLYGAIAGTVVVDSHIRELILGNGFYLIEPSGEDVTVTAPASGATAY